MSYNPQVIYAPGAPRTRWLEKYQRELERIQQQVEMTRAERENLRKHRVRDKLRDGYNPYDTAPIHSLPNWIDWRD